VKIKTDENIGWRAVELLRAAGHDVTTVFDQKMTGSTDEAVFAACCTEQRALVTLDRDFGEPLRLLFSRPFIRLSLGAFGVKSILRTWR